MEIQVRTALQRRFAHEREHRGHPEMEVVLGAESRETLESTHARYFKSIQELANTGM